MFVQANGAFTGDLPREIAQHKTTFSDLID